MLGMGTYKAEAAISEAGYLTSDPACSRLYPATSYKSNAAASFAFSRYTIFVAFFNKFQSKGTTAGALVWPQILMSKYAYQF